MFWISYNLTVVTLRVLQKKPAWSWHDVASASNQHFRELLFVCLKLPNQFSCKPNGWTFTSRFLSRDEVSELFLLFTSRADGARSSPSVQSGWEPGTVSAGNIVMLRHGLFLLTFGLSLTGNSCWMKGKLFISVTYSESLPRNSCTLQIQPETCRPFKPRHDCP